MRKPSVQGLTLIELLVVFVIIGLMASAFYPDYRSFMQSRRLNGAAFAVALDLMEARSQAVNMNRDVTLSFPSSPSGQYTFDATGTARIKNIQTGMGYYDVTLWADYNPIFTSRGMAKNAVGTNPVTTITVRNSAGATKTITVNIAGQVTRN